jgi:hypothetical protein
MPARRSTVSSLCPQSAYQPFTLEGQGAQLVNQQSHFLKRLLRDLAQPGLIPGDLLQVFSPDHSLPCFGQQRQAVERLGHRIVEFTRQSVALLQHSQLLSSRGVGLQLPVSGLKFGLLFLAFIAGCYRLEDNGDKGGQEEIDDRKYQYQGQTHLKTKPPEQENRGDRSKDPSDQKASSLGEIVHDLHDKGTKQNRPEICGWSDNGYSADDGTLNQQGDVG